MIGALTQQLPTEFVDYYYKLLKLKFEEEPDYNGFQSCLQKAWANINKNIKAARTNNIQQQVQAM